MTATAHATTFYVTKARQVLIDWLSRIGGERVADPGRYLSAPAMIEESGYEGTPVAWSQLLYNAERIGLIERDVRGKRTTAIRLCEPFRVPAVEPEPEANEPEREPVDVDAVVDAVVAKLIRRLSSEDHVELERARHRLAETLEANDRLRRKLRDAEEATRAHASEAVTLRRRVSTLEANVEVMKNGERDIEGERGRRQTARLMEDPARSKGRRETA